MADLEAIRSALASGDHAAFVRAMSAGAGLGLDGLPDLARGYLRDDRPEVRNTAAMALSELGDPEAPAAIKAALARPGVAPQSGTLLYVLRSMGASVTPGEAAIVVEHGSFEARGELVEMLVDGLLDMSGEDDLGAISATLAGLTERDDGIGWAAEALLEQIQRHAPGSTATP